MYQPTVVENPTSSPPVSVSKVSTDHEQDPGNTWDPPINLRYLNELERVELQDMLREECQSFSKSDADIGCTEKLQLNVSLKDIDPVACTYLSVPKPLYKEMKDYLHNLIAQVG